MVTILVAVLAVELGLALAVYRRAWLDTARIRAARRIARGRA